MARFPRFLLGGAIGAGLALLFAPKPGRELRRLLMHGKRPAALPSAREPYQAPPAWSPEPAKTGANTLPAANLAAEPADASSNGARTSSPAVPAATQPPEPAAPHQAAPVPTSAEKPAAPVDQRPPAAAPAAKPAAPTQTSAAKPAPAQPATPAQPASAGEKPTAAPAVANKTQPSSPDAIQQPAAKADQAGFDQEDMRRRIEETRARLKAKAFDALVSGESFIVTEKEKEQQQKREHPQVDREVEEKVDQAFKERY